MLPLQLLMIAYEFPPIGGGTGMACSQLLGELAGRTDLEIDLVTSGTEQRTQIVSLGDNITVHRLPVRKRNLHFWRTAELLAWTPRAVAYASHLARRRRYDVCHCWAGWPSGLIGYWLRHRIPYIVSLRGSDVPGYNTRLRFLDPLVMRHVVRRVWGSSARVVAVSRSLRDLALQTQPNAVIDVIPNGVDVRRFVPGPVGRDRQILFVGRLIERKGVHFLLQAFGGVVQRVPDAMLTIVGDGPERERLQIMAAELGLSGRVDFRGNLTGDAIAAVYQEHALLIMPAMADAMPNVVLEAMAAGLAIVTTATGASEVLRGNGITVPCADPASLGHALLTYLTDPVRLAEHRAISRQLATTMSWASVAEFCLELYGEAAAARPQALPTPPREFRLKTR